MTHSLRALAPQAAALVTLLVLSTPNAFAHCDGIDGPVVQSAIKALETGNLNPALIWVQKSDEPEVRAAFEKTLHVRKLSAPAKELADTFFFETLVRLHRAGEGEPYTGLKPAGRDLGPALPAADRALETGSVEPLIKLLSHAVEQGIRHRFQEAAESRPASPTDVEAGRRYVRAYVSFIHYAQRLYDAATSAESIAHAMQADSRHGHP